MSSLRTHTSYGTSMSQDYEASGHFGDNHLGHADECLEENIIVCHSNSTQVESSLQATDLNIQCVESMSGVFEDPKTRLFASNRNSTISRDSNHTYVRGEEKSLKTREFSINSNVGIIEIIDQPTTESPSMQQLGLTATLKVARKTMINHYYLLLKLLGWKTFCGERYEYRKCVNCFNYFYLSLVIICLLTYYTLLLIECPGRLYNVDVTSLRSDMEDIILEERGGFASRSLELKNNNTTEMPLSTTTETSEVECMHRMTTYAVPSLVNFMCWIGGFWYYRLHGSEKLMMRIEQIFIRSGQSQLGSANQHKIIKRMRKMLIFGGVWLLWCLGCGFFSFFGLGKYYSGKFEIKDSLLPLYVALELVKLLGGCLYSLTFVVIILNYSAQCELSVFAINCAISDLRAMDINEAMKDCWSIREHVVTLNGASSKLVALTLINVIQMFLIDVMLSVSSEDDSDMMIMIYRFLVLVMWISIFLVPLVQASRVKLSADNLKNASLDLRIFDRRSPQLDLDSYATFVDRTSFQPYILYIPVTPKSTAIFMVTVFLVLTLLVQSNLILAENQWV